MLLEVGPEGCHARGGPRADIEKDALSIFQCAAT